MAGRPRSRPLAHDDAGQQSGSIQALDRGLALLAIIAQGDGLLLTSIAQQAGMAPSTAHRILATLKAGGFVQCDDGRYMIGVQAFRIGNAFLRNRKLADVGRAVMRELLSASGETTNLGIESDGTVVFIAQLESHQAIRAFHRPGSRGALHASSLGKAMLAWMPEASIDQLLARSPLERFTDRTIVDRDDLIGELEAVRARGWSIDDEERAEGMRCVGAPVFNEHAEVIGALSISGPTVRMTHERVAALGPLVQRAAAELTERVGGVLPA